MRGVLSMFLDFSISRLQILISPPLKKVNFCSTSEFCATRKEENLQREDVVKKRYRGVIRVGIKID